jgi:hypothetical protein
LQNARKNVPNVEGTITRCPKIKAVEPARNTSMSSMLSTPASIPDTSDITLRPASAAPGTLRSSHTLSFTSPLDPETLSERCRQQQSRITDQALLIKADRHCIDALGTLNHVRLIMHHMGDPLTGPRLPHTTAIKSLLRRTFKPQARTEPAENSPRLG